MEIAGLILIVFLAITILKLKDSTLGPTLNNPKKAVRYILDHYDQLVESDFQKIERTILKKNPHDPLRSTIHALRISLTLKRVSNLKTLASRWNTTKKALLISDNSSLTIESTRFLESLYLQRYRLIAIDLISQIDKNKRAKGRKVVDESQYLFYYELPGLSEAIKTLLA